MGLVAAITAGLVAWIVLWSLGAKGFDAFMVTVVVVVLAATVRMLAPHLPGRHK
jgi:Mn2+/Fe2+ NRAMP family transporter